MNKCALCVGILGGLAAWLVLTPALAVPTVAGTTNIAAAANGGRIVAFSSELLDENKQPVSKWQVTNLIDGKYVVGSFTPADSYGWASMGVPSEERPEWVIIGFTDANTGQEVTRLISRVVIDPTTDDPPFIGRWVKGITLQVSSTTKEGPWMTVGRFLVVNRPVKQTFDFPPVEARYLRVLITSNHGSDKCVEMGEIEVYEALVPGEQLDELIIRLENVLNDLKRYRDAQLYKAAQESTARVTEKPAPPAPPGAATEGPAGPAPTPAPPGPATPERLHLGGMSLVLPPGWSRAEDLGDLGTNVLLVLTGPEVGGQELVFTVSAEPLAPGTSLADFAASVARRWPDATLGEGKSVQLAGVGARYFVASSPTAAYLNYCLLRDDKGITFTCVGPPGAIEETQQALQPLLDSLQMEAPG